MAGNTRTYTLAIAGDIARYQKEFAQIPGYTEKKAAAAAQKLAFQMKKAQDKAAADAKKASARAAAQWKKAFRGFSISLDPRSITQGIASIAGLGQQVADLRNEYSDLGTASALTAQDVAALDLAAKGSGQTLSDIAPTLKRLPLSMASAAEGTGKAAAAFDALGVSVEDGAGGLRDAGEVLRDTQAALSGMEDKERAAALAADIFGKSAGNLTVALSGVPLDAYGKQIEATSLLTDGAAESAANWQRQMAELSLALDGAKARAVDFFSSGDLIDNFTLGFVYVSELIPFLVEGWYSRLERFVGAVGDLFKGEFSNAEDLFVGFVEWDDIIGDAMDSARESAQAFHEGRVAIAEANDAAAEYAGTQGTLTTATTTTTKAITDQAKALEAAQQEVAAVTEAALAGVRTRSEQLDAAYAQQLSRLDELQEAGVELADIEAARAALAVQYEQDLSALRQDNLQKLTEAQRRQHEEAMAALEEERSARLQTATDISSVFGNLSQIAMTAAQAESEANKAAAEKSLQTAKRLARAEVFTSSAVGAVNAVTQNPGRPLATVAALAAVATAAASSLQQINQTKLHQGGLSRAGLAPDERSRGSAIVLDDERTLSPEGTRNLGPEGARAVERGMPLSPTVVPMPVYKHFGRFGQDEARRGDPFTARDRRRSISGRRSY